MRLRLGHGHSNREGQNGVTREVALGPSAKATALAQGLVIKPQKLPCWHAEPLLYLRCKHVTQSCFITVLQTMVGKYGSMCKAYVHCGQ